MAGAPSLPLPSAPAAVKEAISWRQLGLLVALLNAPLLFNGCDMNETRFSAGTAISFAELTVSGQPSVASMKVTWWSAWRAAANFVVLGGGLWVACRQIPWLARLAQSRWFVANLVLVAAVFNSWLYLPPVCFQLVLMPTLHLASFLQWLMGAGGGSNDAVFPYVLSLSARLYYVACVAGIVGVAIGLRAFFRRYFFVPSGPLWQVQLGGLMTVVLVLGTAIGLVVRLLMQ